MEEKLLGRASLLKLVKELEDYESEDIDMISVYAKPQNLSWIDSAKIPEETRGSLERISKKLESSIGIVFFSWGETINLILFPPFPVKKDEIILDKKFRTEQLKEIFEKDYRLGIVLMHLGEYAVGIFKGKRLILSKCGKRLVRGKHRKGGFSQARFSRIREIQANKFFNELYGVLRDRFKPHLKELDYVLYGGPKLTIKKFKKRNDFIKKLSEKTLERTLEVREVNKKSLERILSEVWKTKVLYLSP